MASVSGIPNEMVIVYSYGAGNESNGNIALYLRNKYPNMIIGYSGEYTPITEDIIIEGSGFCDGKVIGVAKWDEITPAIVLYTQESLANGYLLRVVYEKIDDWNNFGEIGNTWEYFWD